MRSVWCAGRGGIAGQSLPNLPTEHPKYLPTETVRLAESSLNVHGRLLTSWSRQYLMIERTRISSLYAPYSVYFRTSRTVVNSLEHRCLYYDSDCTAGPFIDVCPVFGSSIFSQTTMKPAKAAFIDEPSSLRGSFLGPMLV